MRRQQGRLLLWLLLAMLACQFAEAQPRWRVAYQFDELRSELRLADFVFPSVRRGIAIGTLTKQGRPQPVALITSDGGVTWNQSKLPKYGTSLFFLDDSIGWMVAEDGVWQTLEGGRTWQRVSKQKNLLRVHFLNEQRGWAVGIAKTVLQTTDGGRTWSKLVFTGEQPGSEQRIYYNNIAFADAKVGLITGNTVPPQRQSSVLYPEEASTRPERPGMLLLLQTKDGGATWSGSATTAFGQVFRLRLDNAGTGLALFRFAGRFEWPSELYRLALQTGKSDRILNPKDYVMSDVLRLPDGTTYLGAVQRVGTLPNNTLPTGLRMFRSGGALQNWEELPTDYRAYGTRVILAAPDSSHVWAATDRGAILRLADR